MTPSIADAFTAQLQDLKKRSDESDKSIKQHLSNLHNILDEMEAIDKKYEQELREI
jgi:Skp family chaperone for outer membrane proteins